MMTLRILATAFLLVSGARCLAQAPAEELARVLRDKQLITAAEFAKIVNASPTDGVRQLVLLLRDKGLLTAAESAGLNVSSAPSISASIATPAPETAVPARAPDHPQKPADPGSDPTRKLNFYGTLLFNAYFNDQASNNADIPSFAPPKTSGPQNNFGATERQTRLGLSYSGLKAAGGNVSGTVEADFFGGVPALTNGINMDVSRMRLAYGRLDWNRFAIEAGQDWTIFAPLNPASLAEFAIPEFSASGNLWIRTPQIRTEWKSDPGKRRTLLWQLAALDPDIGDNPAAYSTARQPKAGELGRLPAVETRLALSSPIGQHTATVGVSGHWGAGKNTTTGGVAAPLNFESWGVAADYVLPVSRFVNISGEAYAGAGSRRLQRQHRANAAVAGPARRQRSGGARRLAAAAVEPDEKMAK